MLIVINFFNDSASVGDPEVSKTVSISFHGDPKLAEEPYTIVHDSVKDKVRFCCVVTKWPRSLCFSVKAQ